MDCSYFISTTYPHLKSSPRGDVPYIPGSDLPSIPPSLFPAFETFPSPPPPAAAHLSARLTCFFFAFCLSPTSQISVAGVLGHSSSSSFHFSSIGTLGLGLLKLGFRLGFRSIGQFPKTIFGRHGIPWDTIFFSFPIYPHPSHPHPLLFCMLWVGLPPLPPLPPPLPPPCPFSFYLFIFICPFYFTTHPLPPSLSPHTHTVSLVFKFVVVVGLVVCICSIYPFLFSGRW